MMSDGNSRVFAIRYIINDKVIAVKVEEPNEYNNVQVSIRDINHHDYYYYLKIVVSANIFSDINGDIIHSLFSASADIEPLMDRLQRLLYYKCVKLLNHEFYFNDTDAKWLVPRFQVNVIDANTIVYRDISFKTSCDFNEVLRDHGNYKVSLHVYDQIVSVFTNAQVPQNVKSAHSSKFE